MLEAVEAAISLLESHPDEQVREAVRVALEGIDAVHRAGLTHLLHAIHGMAGEAFITRLVADPAIRLLLASYGLIAVDRRLLAEEALDPVRGHLHAHGVDVEILEVVGGVVYVRIHSRQEAGMAGERVEGVRRDIEAALDAGLVGFQELVVRDREAPAAPSSPVIPLSTLRLAKPVYYDAMPAEDLPPGGLRGVEVNGVPLLFARVDGGVHALRNRCGDSPLPLEFGTLHEATLRCSWHGCLYDVRTGRRLDGEGRVQVYPVSVQDGRIRVALGVEPGRSAS